MIFPITMKKFTQEQTPLPDLLAFVRHVGTHGIEPFEGIKDLLIFPILGLVDDLVFFRDLSHSLLGKAPSAQNSRRERKARMMYLARFSMACSSPVWILGPQKTLNPDPASGGTHQYINISTTSSMIFSFESSILKTLCRKISSRCFNSNN
jgi:hypothetical protein